MILIHQSVTETCLTFRNRSLSEYYNKSDLFIDRPYYCNKLLCIILFADDHKSKQVIYKETESWERTLKKI